METNNTATTELNKKVYATPQLIVHGTVTDLTKAGGAAGADAIGGS